MAVQWQSNVFHSKLNSERRLVCTQIDWGTNRNGYSFFKYYDQTVCTSISPDRSPLYAAIPTTCVAEEASARLQACGNFTDETRCGEESCNYVDSVCTDTAARAQAVTCAGFVQEDSSLLAFENPGAAISVIGDCRDDHACKDDCTDDEACTYSQTLLITVNFRYSCGFQSRGDARCSYAYTAGERTGERLIQMAKLLPDDECPGVGGPCLVCRTPEFDSSELFDFSIALNALDFTAAVPFVTYVRHLFGASHLRAALVFWGCTFARGGGVHFTLAVLLLV